MPTHFWRGHWQGRNAAGQVHQRAREVVRPTGGILRGFGEPLKTSELPLFNAITH